MDPSIDARNTLDVFSYSIDGAIHASRHLIFVRHELTKSLFKHHQKQLRFLILFPVILNSTHYYLRMRKYAQCQRRFFDGLVAIQFTVLEKQ